MAGRKTKGLSPGPGNDLKKVLEAVEETLRNGNIPEGPVISADEENQKKLNEILAEIVAVQQFALAIAEGDLSKDLAVKGYMAGSLKTLQSNLRHLTWQAGQIAGGDLTQQVHFMGEFSDSFNTMVERLSKDKTNRTQREDELRRLNAALEEEVAEHRKTEEALRESRQILEAVLNNIPVRVFWKDKNSVYLGCNIPFARDAGFEKPEDLIGKDDHAMGWREQAELYRGDDRAVIESGKPKLLFEEPQTTPSGEKIHLLTSKVPLKDAEGEVIGVLGTYLDITELKQANEKLEYERKQLLSLFNSIDEIVYVSDPNTYEILYVNDTFMRAFEKNPVGGICYKEFQGFDHPCEFCTNEIILKNKGKPYKWEYHNPFIDRDYDIVDRIITWPDGREVRFEFAKDITERKKAEAEILRVQQEVIEHDRFLQLLIDTIPNPIFYKDRDGIYTGCNTAFEGYIGFPKKKLIGSSVYDIAPKGLADIYYTADKELLDNPGTQTYESHVKYADGSIHDVIFNKATFTDLKGDVDGLVGVILDITERKKAEEEERLTRERFETLVKVSAMRDASETELSQYVMEAACRMTGSTLAFIGMMTPDESVMDIVAWSESTMQDCKVATSPIHFPIEKAGIWADAIRTRKTKIVNDYSASHPGKKGLPEGHVGITRFLSLPILDHGKVVMVAAVANKPQEYDDADVTRLTLLMQGVWSNLQRRRAEEALIESEYRFRELFNSMTSGVAVYRAVDNGADFEFLDFNHGAEIIETVKKQDVIGKRVTEAFPGVEEFGLLEVFRRVWHTGESEHHPISLYKDQRISSWRENYVYRLPSLEIVAIYEDVTKSKQAEEALRQNENMYRTLFQDSPISLWEEDFSDVKNWIDAKKQENVSDFGAYLKEHPEDAGICASMVKVIHINHATVALFDAASSKEFCEGLSVIFSAESLDAFCEEIVALSKGEKEFEKEIPLRTLKGEKKIVIMKVTVVPGYEETFSRIFVSVIDITQRKNMEEALKEANKKLNMLSSITRHDILNQIMAIRGYLELSKHIVEDPKLQEYMAIENNAVDTIQRQIEFTRYYQDIGVEEPKWQDAGDIVDDVAEQLDLRGIAMDNSISGIEIFADPLIEKVFYNLIENSLRHGEHVTAISFSYAETDDNIVISYRDDGVGISEEDKKKLFRRGFGKHTGLGLFLSQEILSITGISIRETGEQGKGVNFEITVPKGDYRYNVDVSTK